MTEQEFRKKIAKAIDGSPYTVINPTIAGLLADQIIALINQAGYSPPAEIAQELDKQFSRIAEARGYVRLAEDQNLPEPPMFDNCQLANVCCIPLQIKYQLAQQDMLKIKEGKAFRKVEL